MPRRQPSKDGWVLGGSHCSQERPVCGNPSCIAACTGTGTEVLRVCGRAAAWGLGPVTGAPDRLLQELDGLQVLLPQVVGLHQHEEALRLGGQPRLGALHLAALLRVGLNAALPAGG